MPRIEAPPEPWRSFFAEVDSRLGEDVQPHCRGGFVVTQLYGVTRTTSDVDFLDAVPNVRSDLTPDIQALFRMDGEARKRLRCRRPQPFRPLSRRSSCVSAELHPPLRCDQCTSNSVERL